MQTLAIALSVAAFRPERVSLFTDTVLPSYAREGVHVSKIFYDDVPLEGNVSWFCAKRSLEWLHAEYADNTCVSHYGYACDDIEVLCGFAVHAERLLREHPGACVSLFQPTGIGDLLSRESDLLELYRSGQDFAIPPHKHGFWGGTVLFPKTAVPRLLKIAEQIPGMLDDDKLTSASRLLGVEIWCSGELFMHHVGAYYESVAQQDASAKPAKQVSDRQRRYRSGDFLLTSSSDRHERDVVEV